jgi:DNA-binding protein HU-beta
MTKADIVNEIASQTGIDKVIVLGVVESFMDTIKSSMIKGENIYVRGFGSFILKKRAAKLGRNITKNTAVKIPAHNIPAFKPCKEFVDEVKMKVKIK